MRRVAVYRQNLFVASETFIRAQAAALTGWEPTFVGRRPIADAPPGVRAVSLHERLSRPAMTRYAVTARSADVTAVLGEIDPQVIHAHFGPDGLYASRSARDLDVPLVVTLHGRDVTMSARSLLASRKPVAANYALRRRRLTSRAAVVLCVSDYLRQAAIRRGMDPDRLRTHYIGVDTDVFAATDLPAEPVIVHIARLVEKKGTGYLIDALRAVVDAVPDAQLRIVGDGPLRPALEQRAAELGLTRHVRFLGPLPPDGVRAELRAARVYAQPSVTAANGDQEGLPISLLEAMSTGTAIVATRHSGIPEAIADERHGRLVPERSVGELAEALTAYLADDAAAAAAGRAAAERARAHFDLRRQTAALERIYEDVQ